MPEHEPPDMRLLIGISGLRYQNPFYSPQDVVMVNELFCKFDDLSIYNQLLAELKATGKEQEGLWASWHGDTR